MSLRSRIERRVLERLVALVDDRGQPNFGALSNIAKRIRLVELNVKAFGYELARQLAEAMPVPEKTYARHVGLKSKASTQADLESDWASHWLAELKIPRIFHRKLWELSYLLQALHENGHLKSGSRGLGFGCGTEPIPSYLASRGVAVTVTDLAQEEAKAKGWVSTNQHTSNLNRAFHAHLVERAAFERLVELRVADMNHIPPELRGYDFCWSVCALEHLGSIEKGLDFIEASLATLRPGGLAVHTMEFNIENDGPTVDNWATVLFQRKHLERLAERLTAQGHEVAELDFHFGNQPMDRFIDVAPFSHDLPSDFAEWIGGSIHLKLGVEGFVSTCFGLIVRQGSQALPLPQKKPSA